MLATRAERQAPALHLYLFTLHVSFFLSSVGSLREGAGAVRRLKENALCYLCANISSAGSFHRYRGPPPSQREANIASISRLRRRHIAFCASKNLWCHPRAKRRIWAQTNISVVSEIFRFAQNDSDFRISFRQWRYLVHRD